jgi:two-component system, NarL family, sensor histidine kinase UhpB
MDSRLLMLIPYSSMLSVSTIIRYWQHNINPRFKTLNDQPMQAARHFNPVPTAASLPSADILAWHQREMYKAIRAVKQQERQHIGHELHDNINQLLAVAKLSVESLSLNCDNNRQIRDLAVNTLLKAMEEIRNLSRRMILSSLQHKGFIDSVQELADQLNQTSFIRATVHKDSYDYESLACEKKTALFRIVQEQMNNVIKHSQASQVCISLKCAKGLVHLHIKDNGIGFNIKTMNEGVGLPGIQERASIYGGDAAVKSSVGHGCSLYVHIPY